jgi:hypothetical protein
MLDDWKSEVNIGVTGFRVSGEGWGDWRSGMLFTLQPVAGLCGGA